MILFSESIVKGFVHTNNGQRWGQAFYGYMKLHKVENEEDKIFCDKLYNADDGTAKAMVASRTMKGQ